ncbi:MAG: LlaJI family restriction endonuclease [Fibrobacter sp.]|nr:LlaJI family restriction endonuclease [Fibrobacter sp.]
MQKLNDICFCETKTKSGEEFVGIRCVKSSNGEKYKTEICFPMGYFKDDAAIRTLPEETIRESVMNLFSVLTDADLLSKIREDSSIAAMSEEAKETVFPMLAYLNVIRNYLDYGYITEKGIEHKKGAHGKVNWNRTIKMTRPVITEDEKNLVYLDLIARKVNYNEDCLITLVHKFCVHDALKRLGFLFGIDPTEEPCLDFDYELFCSAVNAKLSRTFNDHDLRLLSDLAKIIEFLAEHQTEDGIKEDTYFGVNKFAPVWEAMVDKIFGKLPQGLNKGDFNPHLRWNDSVLDVESEEEKVLNDPKRSTLKPDTIMVNGDNLFVLDSKYYKFGMTKSANHLPGAESICKQMAYAEYVEQLMPKKEIPAFAGKTSNNIFNAFVMPYSVEADNTGLLKDDYYENRPLKMRYAGYIYGDWKEVNKQTDGKQNTNYRPYHKIACILLDVKSVMQNYAADPNAQDELAKLISR